MFTKVKCISILLSALLIVACGPAPETGAALESSTDASSAIIGGSDVAATEAAAQTSVLLYDTAAKAICTGSLLGNNIVLTAAHCLGRDPRKILVVFTTNISKANKEMTRPVIGAIAHPMWITNNRLPKNTADIAIVKYFGNTPAGYRPVNILPNLSPLKNNSLVLLAGFGISDGVKKSGSGVLRQVMTNITDAGFSQTEIQLEQRRGRGACHGDSGGPAFIVANGVQYLWGITSRGYQDPKDHCNVFSVYTNLLAYLNWVKDSARALVLNNQFNFTQTERNFGRGSNF
jgi:secreted trypsin-like serine protease